MVKRSRDQSQDAPRRLSWFRIVPPDSPFHSQTFSRKSSRPIRFSSRSSRRRPRSNLMPSSPNWRSTTIWVAIPAWSRPGCQRTSYPCMRRQRISRILQRVVEGVPHMQAAGHVRRRNDDRVGRVFGAATCECTGLFPVLVKPPFDICRSVCFFECRHHFEPRFALCRHN